MRLSRFETNRCNASALGPPQLPLRQTLTANLGGWIRSCYLPGVRSERGFTLVEMLIVVGMIGIFTAISVPVFIESNARSRLWTGSEQIGATIRQARLRAISSNTNHRVVFDCPTAGVIRSLIMTGDPAVDDAADRCTQTLDGDSGTINLPFDVAFDSDSAAFLEVSGRGIFTASGAAIPLTIDVTQGTASRSLTVSATGQIAFGNVE